jgi:hypothetical protein
MESSSSRLSSAPFTLLRLLSTGFSPDLRGIPVTDEIISPGFRSNAYLACFFANRTLNVVLMTTMPAKKITRAVWSPLETIPVRNKR